MSSRRKNKSLFSAEYIMLSILEYLYVHGQKTPISKYNIVTNTPAIRQQRANRVNLMTDSLEHNGYIKSEYTSSNITLYKITQKGIEAYEKWIKDFLDFARFTNITTPTINNESLENKNVRNGFSPANPELGSSRQAINHSENVKQGAINNLSPQSLIHSGSPLLGNPSALITIVEFGDFQCKFCDRFAKETEPKINSTYIQTGKANMVFKNFVTHGPDSITAAIAAQCANDQDKFWNFYDILYKNQGEENSGWASADNLKTFASQIIGLDMQKFNSCIDSAKYKSFVDKDNAFAISSGFRGTPTFIIEKGDGSKAETLLVAYPFPSFQAIIDNKL